MQRAEIPRYHLCLPPPHENGLTGRRTTPPRGNVRTRLPYPRLAALQVAAPGCISPRVRAAFHQPAALCAEWAGLLLPFLACLHSKPYFAQKVKYYSPRPWASSETAGNCCCKLYRQRIAWFLRLRTPRRCDRRIGDYPGRSKAGIAAIVGTSVLRYPSRISSISRAATRAASVTSPPMMRASSSSRPCASSGCTSVKVRPLRTDLAMSR